LRDECVRIVATFFCPGAAEELLLDAVLRDTVIRNLTWSTHPDVFLPVYEEIYHLLETSLLRFFAAASVNINLPKQLYWYGVGLSNLLLGIAIAVILITCLPAPPRSSRSWRLFSVPLSSMGCMQIYSAWRGFCSEVWSRGNTQLRVWELQEMDTEAAAHWDRVLDDAERTPAPSAPIEPAKSSPDVAAIAPFTCADPVSPCTPDDPSARMHPRRKPSRRPPRLRIPPTQPAAPTDVPPAAAGRPDARFRRPPVFGPERVVRDPHIQAMHRQVLRDMFWVGFWWTMGYVPLVLAVPGLRRA